MSDEIAKRLRLALEMFDTGLEMMRQRVRRDSPDLDASQVEEKLRAWLRDRPGAEYGDAEGAPVEWPRH